jgi:hypothetical protein
MTRESRWREEWEALRAERALARRKWREAAGGLAGRARAPLGIGRLIRDHPIAAAGIGAAAGALLVKLFLSRAPARRESPPPCEEAARPAPAWSTALRDAALGVAVPWIIRMLEERGERPPEDR